MRCFSDIPSARNCCPGQMVMDQLFYIRTSPTEVVTELMCVGCDIGCGTCHLFTML